MSEKGRWVKLDGNDEVHFVADAEGWNDTYGLAQPPLKWWHRALLVVWRPLRTIGRRAR